jgi:hypothetical protein
MPQRTTRIIKEPRVNSSATNKAPFEASKRSKRSPEKLQFFCVARLTKRDYSDYFSSVIPENEVDSPGGLIKRTSGKWSGARELALR